MLYLSEIQQKKIDHNEVGSEKSRALLIIYIYKEEETKKREVLVQCVVTFPNGDTIC